MSDKINGFTVFFEKSVSEEYMQKVKESIQLLSGVHSVEGIIVEDPNSYIGAMRERTRISNVMIDLLRSDFNLEK